MITNSDLEEQLAKEVREKQDLVMALSKEKHTLTKELQSKIREVKKEKRKIRKHIAVQQELFGEDIISKYDLHSILERGI
jgi:phosphomevalonate kinase